jgi:hypothetical protein
MRQQAVGWASVRKCPRPAATFAERSGPGSCLRQGACNGNARPTKRREIRPGGFGVGTGRARDLLLPMERTIEELGGHFQEATQGGKK